MRRKASLPNCLIENGFQGRLSGQVEKKWFSGKSGWNVQCA